MSSGALGSYLKFLAGVPAFLRREPMSIEEAKATIREDYARRDEVFLEVLQRTIFDHPRSPYLPLLSLAGCELGDIRSLVKAEGIEATLRKLRTEGVYVSFEEFKGRRPIERSGRVFDVLPQDFDNPMNTGGTYAARTSGSTGPSMTIRKTLRGFEESHAHNIIGYWAHGVLGAPTASIEETIDNLSVLLRDARCGQDHERWFAPYLERTTRGSLAFKTSMAMLSATARVAGHRVPRPRVVTLDEMHVVAEWAASRAKANGRALVRANPSHSLRVATAAVDRGLDLTGVTFMGSGDPATIGKARGIERAGARLVPQYTLTETGRVGMGCVRPVDPSDVHLQNHLIALITYPRVVPGTSIPVESFHLTTLRMFAHKVMLNLELDDYGIVERRSCGCPLEEVGFEYHLRDIYSYGKLTGDGVTLVSSDIVRILDEVLPARFGGSSIDYQLVEEEDDRGFTKLSLVVHPRVDIPDTNALVETVYAELSRDPIAVGARSIWKQSGAMRVVRREPKVGSTGKVHPLAKSATSSPRR